MFFEGTTDLDFFKKAAELLNKNELLDRIEIRQRGGSPNLDKLWKALKEVDWETIPQTKIVIYDCDVNLSDESRGYIYRRTIPKINYHPIKKGIENLFSNGIIERAIQEKKGIVDYQKTIGTRRGVEYIEEFKLIDKQEKRNLCDWICENGSKEDFKHFEILFQIIEEIIG